MMFYRDHKKLSMCYANRRGSMMTELLVAATLLIAAMSLAVTVSFRTGKLWQDSRHYDLALGELTNQLERLTAIDAADLEDGLAALEVSNAVQATLPNPKLSGRVLSDQYGARVVLSITWDRPGEAKPLTLVGWIAPMEGEP